MKEIKKLEKLIKSKKNDICVRKVQCVLFKLKEDWNSEEIAPYVGYTPSYVREIQSLYRKIGANAFYLKKTGGRIRENLTLEEEKELLKEFEKPAGEGKIIETSEIHKAYVKKVAEKGGSKIPAKSTTRRMLSRQGWRKIMPRPKHSKNDKTKMENFKKCRVSTNNQRSKRKS